MRIDLLARRWGGPDGGPDGMAVASAFLAWALAELGHEVRAYSATSSPAPWSHPRVAWRSRAPLVVPEDWSADLVISTVAPTWRRTAVAAATARASGRTLFWHHHGGVQEGHGCLFAAPPAVRPGAGWARSFVLAPSSWAAEIGAAAGRVGQEVLVADVAAAKGGHIALAVARELRELRWYALPGRGAPSDLAGWRQLPHATLAPGPQRPQDVLGRARVVLSPTRADVHPLVLVEAAVRGIPVVCSDLPGTRAAAGECGIYLPMGAPVAEWAAAVRAALGAAPEPLRLRPYREVVAEVLEQIGATSAPAKSARAAPQALPSVPAPAPVRHSARRSRPRVAILADVRTWCWARKSQALQRHLSGEFDVEVAYVLDRRPDPIPAADLYHTFEVFMAARVPAGRPYTTGITAHVWDGHLARFGEEGLRRIIHGARAFHANSVLLVEDTRRRFGIKSVYVPNGVDETFFHRTRPRAVADRLVVGFQGKPNPRKGHAIVVEACQLAGVELRDNVRTHRDALDAEGMREFYQDLHVLAVQSDMDGTPNSALEAAACGVAVVGNRIGNLPELIDGSNGILVERSAEDLAAALRSLSPARAVEMGAAARRTIEAAWTWRDLSQNYACMWREALAASDRRVA